MSFNLRSLLNELYRWTIIFNFLERKVVEIKNIRDSFEYGKKDWQFWNRRYCYVKELLNDVEKRLFEIKAKIFKEIERFGFRNIDVLENFFKYLPNGYRSTYEDFRFFPVIVVDFDLDFNIKLDSIKKLNLFFVLCSKSINSLERLSIKGVWFRYLGKPCVFLDNVLKLFS